MPTLCLKPRDRYLKNGASENIVRVIKHVNFQINRVYFEKVKIEGKYIKKQVQLFIHQMMCLYKYTC